VHAARCLDELEKNVSLKPIRLAKTRNDDLSLHRDQESPGVITYILLRNRQRRISNSAYSNNSTPYAWGPAK
jgi:hypothetical protein